MATGAAFMVLDHHDDLDRVILRALEMSQKGQPVIVDVKIDYSKRTRFTRGVSKTVLKHFPIVDKVRFIGRSLWRIVTG